MQRNFRILLFASSVLLIPVWFETAYLIGRTSDPPTPRFKVLFLALYYLLWMPSVYATLGYWKTDSNGNRWFCGAVFVIFILPNLLIPLLALLH